MVEFTYPMMLDTVRTLGILVGISYYIMTLRNQQLSQKHAEDTRKIQLLHDITEWTSEPDSKWSEMMNMEWDDYDDFNSKYCAENNPDHYYGRMRIWRYLNYYGLLIDDGLIDASTYVRIIADQAPLVWSKFRDIIEEMRIVNDNPELYVGMEIIAVEVDKYRLSKGLKPKALT